MTMWYTNIITWNNGGFAANGGKLTVNIIGSTDAARNSRLERQRPHTASAEP